MDRDQTKRILSFLLLKPAISSRNLASLGLVGIFFGVYVAAGGKIEGLPAVQDGETGFGGLGKSVSAPASVEEEAPAQPAPGLDTSKLQFGKKGESAQTQAPEDSAAHPAGSTGLDSLTDRLNKVGANRRPQ